MRAAYTFGGVAGRSDSPGEADHLRVLTINCGGLARGRASAAGWWCLGTASASARVCLRPRGAPAPRALVHGGPGLVTHGRPAHGLPGARGVSVCPPVPAGGPALLWALLAYVDPDVACLQETGSLSEDAAGGLPYRAGLVPKVRGGGLAVLLRHRLLGSRPLCVSDSPACLFVSCELPGGAVLSVVNLHLAPSLSASARRSSPTRWR